MTEYCQKRASHNEPFHIEVNYQSDKEIQTSVKELVWSYQKFQKIDTGLDQVTEDELVHYRNESEIAWWSLYAAFGEHEDLGRTLQDEPYETAADKVIKWADEL